jgi:hypothetical protein
MKDTYELRVVQPRGIAGVSKSAGSREEKE